MPAETSIGLSQETRDRLDEYRGPGHASMEDVIWGLMTIVPPADDILDAEACSWEDCENPLWVPDRPEWRGGVIRWWASEEDEGWITGKAYYCSPEHAAKDQEKIDEMMPTDPDTVIVGGHGEHRVEIEGARFHFADEPKEIAFDVPGAFEGETRHGGEYEYVGEPVYVFNAGHVRHTGVIEEIVHEEAITAFHLGRDVPVEMSNHPEDDRREEWLESYHHWYEQPCPECGETLHLHEGMDDMVECVECGEEFRRDPVTDEDLPDAVVEWRSSQ